MTMIYFKSQLTLLDAWPNVDKFSVRIVYSDEMSLCEVPKCYGPVIEQFSPPDLEL